MNIEINILIDFWIGTMCWLISIYLLGDPKTTAFPKLTIIYFWIVISPITKIYDMEFHFILCMGTIIRHQLLINHKPHQVISQGFLRDETHNFTYSLFKLFQISWFCWVDLILISTNTKEKSGGCFKSFSIVRYLAAFVVSGRKKALLNVSTDHTVILGRFTRIGCSGSRE